MSASLIDPSPQPSTVRTKETPERAERARHTDELVEELAECRDPVRDRALREELIELNMPVAASLAQRYSSRGIAIDDLRQVAYLALVKAVGRFDARSGHALLTFCVPTVRGEIRRYFRDHGWMVRPPRRVQELQHRVGAADADLMARHGRMPTTTELASELDESVADVREATDGRGCFTPASLDRPLGEDGSTTLGDLLSEEGDTTGCAEARIVLGPAVRDLSARDRRILRLRFFDGLTQREIAADIGVTQMQVSRLLARIFRDLRRAVGEVEEPEALPGSRPRAER